MRMHSSKYKSSSRFTDTALAPFAFILRAGREIETRPRSLCAASELYLHARNTRSRKRVHFSSGFFLARVCAVEVLCRGFFGRAGPKYSVECAAMAIYG